MTTAPAELPQLQTHRDFDLAVPTPDHFIPLLYLAGLAADSGETADVLVDGYAMGSLSMTSYTLGFHEVDVDSRRGAPAVPDIPADETNI
jgi:4,5-DOPA dioxygenase extradiol